MKKNTPSIEQQAAINTMLDRQKNVYLYGEGGTGKSWTVDRFLQSLSAEERAHTLLMAPTGVAAQNINGYTIHRSLGLSIQLYTPDAPPKVSDVLKEAQRIVIDEISMVRFDLFDYMIRCIKKAEVERNERIQLICIGDFFQLPPVLKDTDRNALEDIWGHPLGSGYAFQSSIWDDLHFIPIHLTKQFRQSSDSAFTTCLNALRRAVSLEQKQECCDWLNNHLAPNEQADGVYIFPTTKLVNQKNKEVLTSLINAGARHNIYRAKITGEVAPHDKRTDDALELCVGCKVMFVCNDPEGRWVNGSIGKVMDISPTHVTARVNSCTIDVSPYKWTITKPEVIEDDHGKKSIVAKEIGSYEQIPLKLCYAITVHKSQGQTFDQVNVSPRSFVSGQTYVALSRGRSASGTHLTTPIKPDDIIVSPDVHDFYEHIENGLELSPSSVLPDSDEASKHSSDIPSETQQYTGDLSSIERELSVLLTSASKKWLSIYQLITTVRSQKSYTGVFPSFSAWMSHIAKDLRISEAMLWRYLKAGDVATDYRMSGMSESDLDISQVSPDNLSLASTIASGDITKQHELVGKVISGELKRKQLKSMLEPSIFPIKDAPIISLNKNTVKNQLSININLLYSHDEIIKEFEKFLSSVLENR